MKKYELNSGRQNGIIEEGDTGFRYEAFERKAFLHRASTAAKEDGQYSLFEIDR